jgi:lysophospholipase L1-like esterase
MLNMRSAVRCMKKRERRILFVAFMLLFTVAAAAAQPDASSPIAPTPSYYGARWVATWAASPQAATFEFPRPKNMPEQKEAPAVQPDEAASFVLPPIIDHQTVRMTVRASIGGSMVRVRISNAYGRTPLAVAAARVALSAGESAIVPESDRILTFSRNAGFVIPPGAIVVSDPVDLEVPALSDLTISIHVTGLPTAPTVHLTGLKTTHISRRGDFTGAKEIADATTLHSWYWIAGVDVMAPVDAAAVVAFGDSITDGATSTPDRNRSYPDRLAERLAADRATASIAVLNQGISGNRLLADGAGDSALARFDRDVLAQPGVKWLIILHGINDIGMAAMMGAGVAAGDLIAAHRQLIERAHLHGIKVIGGTLLPYEGAIYYSEQGDAVRREVNEWIRTSGAYEAVVDFDAELRDPDNPGRLNKAYFNDDFLHPNDDGYKVMADAIDLSIFRPADSAAPAE